MIENMKTAFSLFARTRKAYNQPVYVNMDITDRCNLRCRMCYQNEAFFQPPRNEARFVSLDTVHQVFSQILPRIFVLGGLGEPLLHKDIIEITKIAASHGSLPMITTNGLLLTKEMSRQLVEQGMGQIKISVDAASKKTYDIIRQGGDFERVLLNIADLVDVERQFNRTGSIIRLEYVIQRYNLHEIIPFIKMAARMGVRVVNFMAINFIAVSEHTEQEYKKDYNLREVLDTLHEARRVAAAHGVQENISELMIGHDAISDVDNFTMSAGDYFFPWYKYTRRQNFVCMEPWLQMGIHRNGDVSICCVTFHPKHYEKALVFGNIHKGDRLDDIWNSPRLQRFRGMVARKKNFQALDLCGQCIYRRHLWHELRKNRLLASTFRT